MRNDNKRVKLRKFTETAVKDENAEEAVTGIDEKSVNDALVVLRENIQEKWLSDSNINFNTPNMDVLMAFDSAVSGALFYALHELMAIIVEKDDTKPPGADEYDEYADSFRRHKANTYKNKIAAIGQLFKIAARLPYQEVYAPAIILGGKRYNIPYEKENWVVVNGELQHKPTKMYWQAIMERTKNQDLLSSPATNERACLHPNSNGFCMFSSAKPAPAKQVMDVEAVQKDDDIADPFATDANDDDGDN